MPFEPVQSEKLSQAVVDQIENLILNGLLRPGERLPSERDLAARLGVSRPSLREAISDLQEEGLLETRPGAGVFVAGALGAQFSPAMVRLIARHQEAVIDYIAFRRDVEAMAVERAASEGSDTDLELINRLFLRMEQAHETGDPEQEAALDAQFHSAIAEAGHNIVMLHVMRAMFVLLHEGVSASRQIMFRQSHTRDELLEQHRKINTALQQRNGAAARRAMSDHLAFVESALIAQQKAAENEAMAQKRVTRLGET